LTYGTLTVNPGNRVCTMATSGAAKVGIGEGQAQESIGRVGAATRRDVTAPMVEQSLAVATGTVRKHSDGTTTRGQGDR
jgi:hypothetical protein